MWWSRTRQSRPSEPPDRAARRVLRRSTQVARRGGIVTGSSFYVGMVPAIVMIYCEQIVLVLRIAAVFGREPSDPVRAAEVLHLQGRYPSVQEAARALQTAGNTDGGGEAPPELKGLAQIVRQVPSMLGLRVRRFRARSVLDKVVAAAEVASYFVPIISIPVWAFANAHASRRLGRAAIDFYSHTTRQLGDMPLLGLPPRPEPRIRRLLIGTAVPLAVAMGILFALLPLGPSQHGLRWAGLAIGEAILALTFARLIRITRLPRWQGADA